jgi:hypothetical protein
MSLFRPCWRRFSSLSRTLAISLVAAAGAPVTVASAQTGIIAFQDHCTHRVYAIRADGTGRVVLPLPALPEPMSAYQYGTPQLLDVTSHGPTTVVYQLAINPRDTSARPLGGLYAVRVTDNGSGVLAPAPAVRLLLPDAVPVTGGTSVNPNLALRGAFSSTELERLALVTTTSTASVLLTVQVDRDASMSVTALSDVVVVADLYSLAPPTGLATQGFTGSIDYAPDGTRIVAAINHDLWLVRLTPAHTLDAAEQLTTNTEGTAEWNPSYSPDGVDIAYTAGPLTRDGTVRTADIYTIAASGGAVTAITPTARKGKSFSSPDDAMWAPDGQSIGFAAYTSSSARRATCSTLLNSELFVINADGSGTASLITDTNGTSVEGRPKWGW